MKEWNDLAELEENPNTKQENLLIIDGNNVAYRFLNRNNYNNFYDEYLRTIESLGKSYQAKRTVVCFDFGKSYYRKKILDTYKGTRKKPTKPEEIKKYEEFFACFNEVIEKLPLENYKFRGVEADDLIARFAITNKSLYEYVWIVSSDKDLYQLLDDNVCIFNMYSRKEITIDTLLEDRGVTPDEALLAKIIQGDPGDNIDGVEGIGEIRSQNLAREYKTLENLIKSLPIKGKAKYIQNLNGSKELLLRNEKLINLLDHHMEAINSGLEGEISLERLV